MGKAARWRTWGVFFVILVAAAGVAWWIVMEQSDNECEEFAERVDRLEARLDARDATEAEETRATLRIAREEPADCNVFAPELLAPVGL